MILKRRDKRSFRAEIKELLWPSMGWRRTLRYYKYRLIRLQDSPAKIARGVATGISISFVPIPGTHFIQIILLSWLMRANVLAALIVSWVGNPWTFPPMWFLAYKVGNITFGLFGWKTADLPKHFTWDDLWRALCHEPFRLVVPWVLGGYLIMAALWPIVYYTVLPLIVRAHDARADRRLGHHKAHT